MPKVSIIVPMYNSSTYLDRCVQTLLHQTLKDIEIILVNDASPDNSLELALDYQKKDNRIKVINLKENIVASRNAGIDAAEGEYLGFVDADDWVDIDFYEHLYKATQNGLIDVVIGEILQCKSNNKKTIETTIEKQTIDSPCEVKKHVAINGGRLFTNIWKRELITSDIYFLEHNLYCDAIVPLWYLKAQSFCKVNGTYYNYFINSESITQRKNSPSIYHRLDAALDMLRRCKRLGLYESYKNEIDYIFYRLYLRNTLFHMTSVFDKLPKEKIHEMHRVFKEHVDIKTNRLYQENKHHLQDSIVSVFLKSSCMGLFLLNIVLRVKQIKEYINKKY